MNQLLFRPRLAAKGVAGSLLAIVVLMALFGVPGICGLVGGIVPKLFPAVEWLDEFGTLAVLAAMLSFPICIAWLAVSGFAAFLLTRRSMPR